jgi:hypothetical protein
MAKAGLTTTDDFKPCSNAFNHNPTSIDCMKEIATQKGCYNKTGYLYHFLNDEEKEEKEEKEDKRSMYIPLFWRKGKWKQKTKRDYITEIDKYNTNLKISQKLKFKNYSKYRQALLMCGNKEDITESFVSNIKHHDDLSDNYKPCWEDFKNLLLSAHSNTTVDGKTIRYSKDAIYGDKMWKNLLGDMNEYPFKDDGLYKITKMEYENDEFPFWDFLYNVMNFWTVEKFKEMMLVKKWELKQNKLYKKGDLIGVENDAIDLDGYKNVDFNEWFAKYFFYIRTYNYREE